MFELMHVIIASNTVTYAACDLQIFVISVWFFNIIFCTLYLCYMTTQRNIHFVSMCGLKSLEKGIPFQFELNFQMFLFGLICAQGVQCATDKKNKWIKNNSIIYFVVKNDLSDCVLISCLCKLHVSFFLSIFFSLSLYSCSFSCCHCRPSQRHQCRHSNWIWDSNWWNANMIQIAFFLCLFFKN